ncbi:error-prone DNA polymerase [Prauserella cavernicola]|uniref:Error-prone DNA polymerase n=1 Tax=Prauserella cavernicola TaxID=2800127 RepID=A0A934QNN4_9PSEU|nr:error-prone DNA polymerase [Prauserella cavernicola]MBK1783555.1 error-prone DNA polymerase [Prauserella cavernicola]
MAFNSPGVSWAELERALSGREVADPPEYAAEAPRARRQASFESPELRVPYAELHAHSYYSFLDGVSSPEALVEEAARLGLDGLVLTDHDGVYGAVRLAEAARELGVRVGFGAELSVGLTGPQNGVADPEGTHLLVIARGVEGYRRLCRVLTAAHLRGEEKGRPLYEPDEVVEELRGHAVVLTGCRKGAVRQALRDGGPAAAHAELRGLVDRFGRWHVAVELVDHQRPRDSARNDLLAGMAADLEVPTVVSNEVHYARPTDVRLAQAVAAVRARRSLDELRGWLPSAGTAHLRSGTEQLARFGTRYPGAVQRAAVLAVSCAFDLQLVAPRLPPFPVPEGHTESSHLHALTWEGAARRYGSRQDRPDAYAQLDRELAIIEELGFPGYFLVVWDIVEFCRRRGILCQGRGSAANSAVCFALGITNADPVKWGLLFERFLAPERDGPPDIDIDIESDRREEAIQYVYETHGRRHAALVANVITYRARSAVRDMAKALGFSPGQQDSFAKQVDRWGTRATAEPAPGEQPMPPVLVELANQLGDAPRHLGIHPGGMVITDQPISEVVPVEWARMPGRTVLQWDKDDCAAIGLVKFDLLGLGMLSAIRYAIELVAEHEGVEVDLAALDLADPAVYDMLCAADAVGVFQVESRAQLATLPRLRPREFYDLVVEVALIRPGPIQGGSVHPYLRRRDGEPWQHAHSLLANSLDRTLGVPLFQEQVMQMAIDVADFSPAEADQLRRAMGAKRSAAKMARLRRRFFAGAAANGITGPDAQRIFTQIEAFSGYGFPEAHSHSFALIVYSSAYLKHYHPAAFTAGLLRAQPMGFYSPQTLVADARRHGVATRGPDLNASLAHPTLEADPTSHGGQAVRLGLAGVRGLGEDSATTVVDERTARGPFGDLAELARRVPLTQAQLEALATAGAAPVGELADRRGALWAAGAAARDRPRYLPGTAPGLAAPALPGMTALELAAADVWATGITPDGHPVEFVRARLDELGALPAAALPGVEDGTRVLVGGAVTHRQRPATAGGITFLNIEDETGMVNVLCSPGLWNRHLHTARNASAMLVRGIVQNAAGTVTLVADQLRHLNLARLTTGSRDFR